MNTRSKHVATAVSIALLGAAGYATPAAAQEESVEGAAMGEVIVTGTRVPVSVDKIPGAISVVSEEEITRSTALTLDVTSVLARTVPGYNESTQSLNNSETLRGRVALRLFDGVPQGSPLRDTARNGTFTELGVIGRIEVINGPSASEGIGAAGGIINYISRTPTEEGTEIEVTARYGSQFEDDADVWRVGATVAHKSGAWDLLGAASYADSGIYYDGNGRRIGLHTSGSTADSKSDNVFLKGGFTFGADDSQRLQLSLSRFHIKGKGNYILVDGDRATGLPNTSERGRPLGAKTEFNEFEQQVLSYTNQALFGGTLAVQAYHADQAMRFLAEDGADRQDPLIAPIGTLIDQSEIRSKKKGLRTSWARQDIFTQGLFANVGLDLVEDVADQRLALTNRLWVPPMEYTSVAPFLQLSYDVGPLTFSGGVRREDGDLEVDSYVTTWFRDRRPVDGGKLSYKETLTNAGVVWRIGGGFSTFVSYSEGFSLPNVGIPLRNVQCSNDTPDGTQPDGCPNDPRQSVAGILDLQAIVVENREIGFNWRGDIGSFGASYYESDSDLGVSLSVDPVTEDFIMLRRPVEIEGYELSGELRLPARVTLTAMYSHIEGKTRTSNTGPLDREMGINDIAPDKIAATVNWRFSDRGDVTLGSTTWVGREINEGRAGEERTSGYTLFDLTANYQFGAGTLSVGIENLTDKFYILGASQVPGFRNYWSGRGRTTSLTYTHRF